MVRKISSKKAVAAKGLTPMDAALKFLEPCARTVREVERRLDELEFGEVEIMDVIDRLKDLKLVDDGAYCSDFVESRLRAKPISRRHLEEQLRSHEASEESIDLALGLVTSERELENAVEVAKKYRRQLSGREDEALRLILKKRLTARGFDYETADHATEKAMEAEE